MNELDGSSRQQCLDEQAAAWLYEREEGFTPERAAEFTAWCNRDPRHAQAFADAERTLELLDELPTARERLEERLVRPSADAATHRRSRVIRFAPIALAAGLAVALLGTWFVWNRAPTREPASTLYAADTAAHRSIALSDGTVVDLNVGSVVSVQFTAAERRVELTRGEAHFQVAPDPSKPFVVIAGGFSVRAVGTAFNVRLAAEAVDVVVVEGKVRVAEGTAPNDAGNTTSPTLSAGERAQMSREDRAAAPKVETIDAAALRALLTWENPVASFTDVPLRDVAARFNRRNAKQLLVEDRELGDRKIGGVLALDQVDAFVRLLEQDRDIVVVRHPQGKIELRRAR